jgi:hypothetical protein
MNQRPQISDINQLLQMQNPMGFNNQGLHLGQQPQTQIGLVNHPMYNNLNGFNTLNMAPLIQN